MSKRAAGGRSSDRAAVKRAATELADRIGNANRAYGAGGWDGFRIELPGGFSVRMSVCPFCGLAPFVTGGRYIGGVCGGCGMT